MGYAKVYRFPKEPKKPKVTISSLTISTICIIAAQLVAIGLLLWLT